MAERKEAGKREILVFGSRLDREDNLALRVAERLKGEKKFSFREAESLLDEIKDNDEIMVMDVVNGIKKVELILPSDLEKNPAVSAHDFDLASEILLLKKLHPEKSIKIIGIPYGYVFGKAAEEVWKILEGMNA